jgi:hypothetical protein
MDKVKRYWKAIAGFVAPGVVLLGASLSEQSEGGTTVTTSEWVAVLVTMFATAGAVYLAPKNATPPPEV